jgi:hypothetical protein
LSLGGCEYKVESTELTIASSAAATTTTGSARTTTTGTAATTTTAATETATTTTATLLLAGLGFVDTESATLAVLLIQSLDCGCPFLFARHLNKSEPAGPPGFPVSDHVHFGDLTVLLKQLSQLFFGRLIRQITDIDSHLNASFRNSRDS